MRHARTDARVRPSHHLCILGRAWPSTKNLRILGRVVPSKNGQTVLACPVFFRAIPHCKRCQITWRHRFAIGNIGRKSISNSGLWRSMADAPAALAFDLLFSYHVTCDLKSHILEGAWTAPKVCNRGIPGRGLSLPMARQCDVVVRCPNLRISNGIQEEVRCPVSAERYPVNSCT